MVKVCRISLASTLRESANSYLPALRLLIYHSTIVQITGNKNPRLVVFPSTVHAIIWNLVGGNKSLAHMGLDEWKGHVGMDPAPLPRRVITVPDDSDHEGDIEMKSETEKSDGGSAAAAEDAFKSMGMYVFIYSSPCD